MNIIVNGFHEVRQKSILDSIFSLDANNSGFLILQDENYSPVYHGIKNLFVSNINKGNYPIVEEHYFASDFLVYIQNNMYILMNMMNRIDSFTKRTTLLYEEKKSLIYKHFYFWYSYISDHIPNFFITSNIPHDIYDYVIFLTLIYFKKTKILYFYQSNFNDIIIPYEKEDFTNEQILTAYKQQKETKLLKLSQIEWDKQVRNVQPFYMNSKIITGNSKLIRLKNFIETISIKKIGNFISNRVNKIFYNHKTNKLKQEYKRNSKTPAYTQNYFYFPLHYQPELTSCPLGGKYMDQSIIIKMLDDLLPDGYRLYVKEHPKQEISNRYIGFYSDILEKSRKTIFVNKDTPSSELISHCKAVVTITGTAGWEALFKLKPVLLFGHNFYEYSKGVFHIANERECKLAIDEICVNKYSFDADSIKKFLNAVELHSIHGFIDPVYKNNSIFSYDESNRNISEYIKKWIKENQNDFKISRR